MCGMCLLVIGRANPIHSILLLIGVFFLGSILLFFLQIEYYARLFLIVYVGAIVVLFLFIIIRLELKRVNIVSRLSDLFIDFRLLILAFFILEIMFFISEQFFDLSGFIHSYFDINLFFSNIINVTTEKTFFSEYVYKNTFIKFAEQSADFIEANQYINWSKLLHRTDHLRALGGLLYTEYKITVILASLLLFLSIIGALVVTLFFPKNHFSTEELLVIKRQDANNQTRRHPNFVVKN